MQDPYSRRSSRPRRDSSEVVRLAGARGTRSQLEATSTSRANAYRSQVAGAPGPRNERRPRRRQSGRWLQRNALSIAAVVLVLGLLGIGFGLLHVVTGTDTSTRPAAPQAAASAQASPVAAASAIPAGHPVEESSREITFSSRTLDSSYTYTVQSGDTLAGLAKKFNTTVERIAAFNNLSDTRLLNVGQKLIIPPPL